jgi:hypothetical protein
MDLEDNATDQPDPTSNPWRGRTHVFQQPVQLRPRKQSYGLTEEETELLWSTGLPRMPRF